MNKAPSLATGMKFLALGHTLIGLVVFQRPLREWRQAGMINAVQPQAHPERSNAFWFFISGWLMYLLGLAAEKPTSTRLPKHLLAFGVVGTLCLPKSGFPLAVLLVLPHLRKKSHDD